MEQIKECCEPEPFEQFSKDSLGDDCSSEAEINKQ
jgi:hypothetical protein